ncbi:hypothetical protein RvY_04058 [Ramazzottius varieornatus]|uniref:Sulfatase N-terminal domain-containing protein n=1 Tax=Ramazzottius varieornatus TaxID=947166 RepID=A0A1D1UZJ7_RAMVA|nr:hypothetical protein RvY_04058 [Ramazzottius varieornatus]
MEDLCCIRLGLAWLIWSIRRVCTLAVDSRPNIILIVADDLGWNDVSFHGSDQIPTPHIDRLAKQGVVLNNYYVTPICTPSRSSLLTGRYPVHLGTQHNVLYATEPWGLGLKEQLLPEYLNGLGYTSHMIGKWHLGFFDRKHLPTRRGFKSHFGYWTGHADYFDHTAQEWTEWGLDLRDDDELVRNLTGHYATDLFTDRAVTLIANHDKSQPLFLYLAHLAVHSANQYDPLQTTRRYYERFPHIRHPGRRLFAGMIAGLDESVERVYHALVRAGMDNNTMIIFTTDNGGPAAGFDDNYANNYPLRGVKDTLWEGGVRGTAFIWSKLLAKPRRQSTQLMHISDWVPTLLSAAGQKLNDKKLDGIDMWSSLSNGGPSPRKEVLLNIDHERGIYALRRGQYKLILGTTYNGDWDGWYPPEGETSRTRTEERATTICGPVPKVRATSCQPMRSACLFNVEKDPCEHTNLADDKPEVVQRLMNRLKAVNATVMPPRNVPADPQGSPRLYGYAWSPWKE